MLNTCKSNRRMAVIVPVGLGIFLGIMRRSNVWVMMMLPVRFIFGVRRLRCL